MRIKRHYSLIAHSADVVELRHGAWNPISFTLADESGSGQLLRILNRLDDHRSAAEIAAEEGVPRSDVEAVLDQLGSLGVLEEDSTHALDYYLDHLVPNLLPFGGDGPAPSASIVLFGDDRIASEVGRVLEASVAGGQLELAHGDARLRKVLARGASRWYSDGLALEEEMDQFRAWRDKLVVFATSELNPLELQALNLVALHHGFAWIHAAVDGPFLLLGPTFVPGRTACYECLETRVLMNLREGASYQSYKSALARGAVSNGRPAPLAAVCGAMLGSLTAFETLNFALTGTSFTVGKLLAVYLPTFEFTFNEVLRMPGCRACSPVPEGDDRELYFDVRTLLGG